MCCVAILDTYRLSISCTAKLAQAVFIRRCCNASKFENETLGRGLWLFIVLEGGLRALDEQLDATVFWTRRSCGPHYLRTNISYPPLTGKGTPSCIYIIPFEAYIRHERHPNAERALLPSHNNFNDLRVLHVLLIRQ